VFELLLFSVHSSVSYYSLTFVLIRAILNGYFSRLDTQAGCQ